MKINSISNVNNGRADYTKNKQQSFKGFGDVLVKFWQNVDKGGRAAQFTVEDMCGTNLPRTYKGAMAGYKYTGKINVAAFLQEFIREFTTGPTMCIMPVLILGSSKKLLGKTSDTHIENIKNLSSLMKQLEGTSKENLDKDFITSVVKDMLRKTTGVSDISDEDFNALTNLILDYNNTLDLRALSKKELNALGIEKPSKNELKEKLTNLEDAFEKTIKRIKPSYADTNFKIAKYTLSDGGVGAAKFKNYVNYAINYSNDFKKTFKDGCNSVVAKNVENFKNGWVAKRFGVISAMIGITGIFMSVIPKLYTKASGNVNPNAKTIYNEAEKLNNKKKGVSA